MTAITDQSDDIEAVTVELLRERGLLGRSSITQTAVARAIAKGLVEGTASSIASASALMAQLPGIVPPEQREQPLPYETLDECDEPREWDMSRLSSAQLDALENIEATACGRATAVIDERAEAAAALVSHLSGEEPEAGYVRGLVTAVLRPAFTPELLFRDARVDDLAPQLLAAQQRISDLEHQLEREMARSSGKLVELSPAEAVRRRAEAAAPIVRTSAIDKMSAGRGDLCPGV